MRREEINSTGVSGAKFKHYGKGGAQFLNDAYSVWSNYYDAVLSAIAVVEVGMVEVVAEEAAAWKQNPEYPGLHHPYAGPDLPQVRLG